MSDLCKLFSPSKKSYNPALALGNWQTTQAVGKYLFLPREAASAAMKNCDSLCEFQLVEGNVCRYQLKFIFKDSILYTYKFTQGNCTICAIENNKESEDIRLLSITLLDGSDLSQGFVIAICKGNDDIVYEVRFN